VSACMNHAAYMQLALIIMHRWTGSENVRDSLVAN
jgi:hypothetical protein